MPLTLKPADPTELLAALRKVEFPPDPKKDPLAFHIAVKNARWNCETIIYYAQHKIARLKEDNETSDTYFEVRREASRLLLLLDHQKQLKKSKTETLRGLYDTLTGSIHHLFTLVDAELAPRVKVRM